MGKKDKLQKPEKSGKDKKKEYLLTLRTKKWIKAILIFLVGIIIALSFFEKSGLAGEWLVWILKILFGDSRLTITTIILTLFGGGFVLLKSHKKVKILAIALAVAVTIIGVSGISNNQSLNQQHIGLIGWVAKMLVNGFGLLVSNIIFATTIVIGLFIFLQFIWHETPREKEDPMLAGMKSSDAPNFRIKGKYSLPPIDLLSKNETPPTSGNIKENSLIIKKTLENFGIPVEMAEVNVGPAVTQYAFKPAEGVKLSKITTLSNNLALALAAHPIRIEAPIPGKSLVGIEVPNKVRATVVLRNLI